MGLSKKIFESDIEVLGFLDAAELQINSIAITATSAELNILDLSATALTTGWGYFADGASTASWRQLLGSEISNDSNWISGITAETLSDLSDIPAEPTGGAIEYYLKYNDTGDVFTWVDITTLVDMTAAVYDPAGITEQLVGLTATQTLTNKTLQSFTNDIYSDHLHAQLRNESGSAMNVGDVVYISGYSIGQGIPLVSLGDASSSTSMPIVAVLNEATLATNANGDFVETGTLSGMDTSAWTTGDALYVSNVGTTGNTLTNVKPVGTDLIQKVCVVIRSHATLGVIEVFGAGRSNDLPNIANTKLWIGDVNGVPQEFTLSGDVTVTAGGSVSLVPTTLSGYGISDTMANFDIACSDGDFAYQNQTVVVADHGVGTTDEVVNVCYGTSATPPAAAGTTEGALYIQYTA